MERVRDVLLALLAQLPLLSALDKWREQVRQRPVLALLLALTYEFLVLTVTIGKDVWKKLQPAVVEYVVDKIQNYLSGFAPAFLRNYNNTSLTNMAFSIYVALD